ncbi:hypothetical protein [Chelativorans intermedius]|uniref:Outer membrane lipoprotein n=1 Tax=Chelativorans intermedius TaxID=515947 RepID=A0ABV6D8W2_9HYPH|nr:hypothetical protein [Chelativorans intermedius]MCT8997733.1 hypothetical protein [Chelativorans intermedius]
MVTTRKIASCAALLSLLAVSGCVGMGAGMGPGPAPARASNVDGEWVGAEGIRSTFRAGAFETRAPDTGEVLATGSYQEQPGGLVRISVQSRVRDPQIVDCLKVDAGGGRVHQLNCTSSSGQSFVLTRAG